MRCGVAVMASCPFGSHLYFWLVMRTHPSLPPGSCDQLPKMDHDYSKPIMPVLFFHASNLSRAELGMEVCPKRNKVGGRTWIRWAAGMVLMRVSCCLFPPFLVCVLFYENLMPWEPRDAKPKHWTWWKSGRRPVAVTELLAILVPLAICTCYTNVQTSLINVFIC